MDEKLKKYLQALFRILWIILSIILWSLCLVTFAQNNNFEYWFIWGLVCTMCMIPSALKFIGFSAKVGYREGMGMYKGDLFTNVYGGIGMSIRDRRYTQAIMSIIAAIIVCLLLGPLFLPMKVVISIIQVIPFVKYLIKEKAFTLKALKITGIVTLVLIIIISTFSIIHSCMENY